MARRSHHDLYSDLKKELGSTFGYKDELKSGSEGFEDLLDAGTIADDTGKRIPRKNGRNDRDRARLIGEHLRRGYPLYIYKKGEKYPREVRYDDKLDKLVVSEQPVTELPEPEKPPRPGGDSFLGKTLGHLLYRVMDVIAMSVGTRLPSMKKWDDYNNAMKARENVRDEHRVNRRLRQDSILNKENSVECTNTKETFKSFAAELKNHLGYEKDLNEKGLVSGISDLAKEGKIIDSNGNPVVLPTKGTQKELIDSIGQRLYGNKMTDTREPLYVYAKGETYPREIFLDNEGMLRVSDKPINEMYNNVPKPSTMDKIGNAISPGRNENVFAYERAEQRRKLFDILYNQKTQEKETQKDEKVATDDKKGPEKAIADDKKGPENAKPEPTKNDLEAEQQKGHAQMNNVLDHMIKAISSNKHDYGKELDENEKFRVSSVELMRNVFEKKFADDPEKMAKFGKDFYDRYWNKHENSHALIDGIVEARKKFGDEKTSELMEKMMDLNIPMSEMGKYLQEGKLPDPNAEKKDPAIDKPKEQPAEKPMTLEEQLAAMQAQMAAMQAEMAEMQQLLSGKTPEAPVQAKEAPEKKDEKVALNTQDKEPQQHQQELKNAENSKAPEEKDQKQPNATQPEAEKHAEEKEQKEKAEEKAANEQAKVKDNQDHVVKQADEKQKIKTSQELEKDALLNSLKKMNGNKELPENVIKNVDQLMQDAKAGENTLRAAVDSPEQALFRGGDAVTAVAAYEATKEMAIWDNPMLLNVLKRQDGASELQKYTRLEPSVAYAADNQHEKEFFSENFLKEEGKTKIAQKLDARFLDVHKKNEALKKSKDPLSEMAAKEKQEQAKKEKEEPALKVPSQGNAMSL